MRSFGEDGWTNDKGPKEFNYAAVKGVDDPVFDITVAILLGIAGAVVLSLPFVIARHSHQLYAGLIGVAMLSGLVVLLPSLKQRIRPLWTGFSFSLCAIILLWIIDRR